MLKLIDVNTYYGKIQALKGIEHRGQLTKRQQPRHIREAGAPAGHRLVHRLEGRQGQHRHRRPGDTPALLESHVHAGDPAHRPEPVLRFHMASQPFLQLAGLGRAQIPGMGRRRAHRSSGPGIGLAPPTRMVVTC